MLEIDEYQLIDFAVAPALPPLLNLLKTPTRLAQNSLSESDRILKTTSQQRKFSNKLSSVEL